MKQGIIIVSFGTSHKDTREKTIAAIERETANTFLTIPVRRAFTSGMIMKKLKERDGLMIPNVKECIEGMKEEGFTHITIQPTHIINGVEYEKIHHQLKEYRGMFEKISVGKPLLTSSMDYEKTCYGIMDNITIEEEEALVLMGHGTDHFADASYSAMEYRFHALGYENVFMGTVEGYPDLETTIAQVEKSKAKKVKLLPFMVVAGDHAKNDMAGKDDSWQSAFMEKGFETECIIKGIGEYKEIRKIYIEHIKEAME